MEPLLRCSEPLSIGIFAFVLRIPSPWQCRATRDVKRKRKCFDSPFPCFSRAVTQFWMGSVGSRIHSQRFYFYFNRARVQGFCGEPAADIYAFFGNSCLSKFLMSFILMVANLFSLQIVRLESRNSTPAKWANGVFKLTSSTSLTLTLHSRQTAERAILQFQAAATQTTLLSWN